MDRRNKLRLAIATIAFFIMVFALIEINYEDFIWKDFLVPVAMALLILAQLLPIVMNKKNEE